jgi:hypothetical protein
LSIVAEQLSKLGVAESDLAQPVLEAVKDVGVAKAAERRSCVLAKTSCETSSRSTVTVLEKLGDGAAAGEVERRPKGASCLANSLLDLCQQTLRDHFHPLLLERSGNRQLCSAAPRNQGRRAGLDAHRRRAQASPRGNRMVVPAAAPGGGHRARARRCDGAH